MARAHRGDARAAERALSRARSLLSGQDAALAARSARCLDLARRGAALPVVLPW